MADLTQFRKNMADTLGDPIDGVATTELHRDDREVVSYSHIDTGATFENTDIGGIEMLVINGMVMDGGGTLKKSAWLRLPEAQSLSAVAGLSLRRPDPPIGYFHTVDMSSGNSVRSRNLHSRDPSRLTQRADIAAASQ